MPLAVKIRCKLEHYSSYLLMKEVSKILFLYMLCIEDSAIFIRNTTFVKFTK